MHTLRQDRVLIKNILSVRVAHPRDYCNYGHYLFIVLKSKPTFTKGKYPFRSYEDLSLSCPSLRYPRQALRPHKISPTRLSPLSVLTCGQRKKNGNGTKKEKGGIQPG